MGVELVLGSAISVLSDHRYRTQEGWVGAVGADSGDDQTPKPSSVAIQHASGAGVATVFKSPTDESRGGGDSETKRFV